MIATKNDSRGRSVEVSGYKDEVLVDLMAIGHGLSKTVKQEKARKEEYLEAFLKGFDMDGPAIREADKDAEKEMIADFVKSMTTGNPNNLSSLLEALKKAR